MSVMEYMCLGGTVVPEGFVVGMNGALQVENDSEQYEREPGEQPTSKEEIKYGQGKRAVENSHYSQKELWCQYIL
jgi:hypothetical protein